MNHNSTDWRPIEILLIEDNPGDVDLTKEALQDAKVRNRLNVVDDGAKAVDFLYKRGAYADAPPSPAEARQLATRVTDLHPMTIMQNARTSAGGQISLVPARAATGGPGETWKAEKVSIWHPGWHDNAFGMRLTALMISKHLPDAAVPMSLLADHPQVQFNFYRPAIGDVTLEMH